MSYLRALADLLAPAAGLHRLYRSRTRALKAGAPTPDSDPSFNRSQVAVPGVARRADRRLANSGSNGLPQRPDRARYTAAIRVCPHVARWRPGDVGQPPHDAPRPAIPGKRAARCAPNNTCRGRADGRTG